MLRQLEGKIAVVTGGGQGIGKAIAIAFAREGADICLVARTRERLEEVASEIQSIGPNALVIPTDVTVNAQVQGMADRIKEIYGKIDLLVNNAGGVIESNPFLDSDPERWIKDVTTNLISVYLVTHALLPLMIQAGGGHIINMGSGMGHTSGPKNSAYHVGKAGQWMFTRCLAEEVWEHGINVNELVPGPVASRDSSRVGSTHVTNPSERVKATEDVVPVALFLATQPSHGPIAQSFSIARRPI